MLFFFVFHMDSILQFGYNLLDRVCLPPLSPKIALTVGQGLIPDFLLRRIIRFLLRKRLTMVHSRITIVSK